MVRRIAPHAGMAPDLERKLLEIGLTEGSVVEVLQEGFPGHDPMAIRVDDMILALRRKEAEAVEIMD